MSCPNPECRGPIGHAGGGVNRTEGARDRMRTGPRMCYPTRRCGVAGRQSGGRQLVPPPHSSGAGAGPRASRPAPAAGPPRHRPGAAGRASADRPSMEGTRRALLHLAAACCLLCALPGTGDADEGCRGGGADRGMPPVSPRWEAQRQDSRRGSAGTRVPLPVGGATGEGSGEPSDQGSPSGEQRPGPAPRTRAKCPRPREPSPRRRRR